MEKGWKDILNKENKYQKKNRDKKWKIIRNLRFLQFSVLCYEIEEEGRDELDKGVWI